MKNIVNFKGSYFIISFQEFRSLGQICKISKNSGLDKIRDTTLWIFIRNMAKEFLNQAETNLDIFLSPSQKLRSRLTQRAKIAFENARKYSSFYKWTQAKLSKSYYLDLLVLITTVENKFMMAENLFNILNKRK
jgi:hypothetical protein